MEKRLRFSFVSIYFTIESGGLQGDWVKTQAFPAEKSFEVQKSPGWGPLSRVESGAKPPGGRENARPPGPPRAFVGAV
jgi:hypothetical protein